MSSPRRTNSRWDLLVLWRVGSRGTRTLRRHQRGNKHPSPRSADKEGQQSRSASGWAGGWALQTSGGGPCREQRRLKNRGCAPSVPLGCALWTLHPATRTSPLKRRVWRGARTPVRGVLRLLARCGLFVFGEWVAGTDAGALWKMRTRGLRRVAARRDYHLAVPLRQGLDAG